MEKKKYAASVIVSVYNHWEWLRLILEALSVQTRPDFEIVIADDGSDSESVGSLQQYVSEHPRLAVKHVWHEDEGWRKDIILNKAVMESESDYLIFIDGDCVPHPRFVSDHLRLKRRGAVVAGRRIQLPERISLWLERKPHLDRKWFCRLRPKMVKALLGSEVYMLLRCVRFPFVFGMPLLVKRKSGILGCNFSLYRDDLLAVNGFDERYLDPACGEDTDVEYRLRGNGVEVRKTSHYALMVHRCHKTLIFRSERNERIFADTQSRNLTYTPYGINRQS